MGPGKLLTTLLLVLSLGGGVDYASAGRRRALGRAQPNHDATAAAARGVIVALREADPLAARQEAYVSRAARHAAILARMTDEYALAGVRPAVSSLHTLLSDANVAGAKSVAEIDAALAAGHPRRRQRVPPGTAQADLLPLYILEPARSNTDIQRLCRELATDRDVLFAEPDQAIAVFGGNSDPLFARQWALHNVGQPYPVPGGEQASGRVDSDLDAPEAWATLGDGIPIVVAVIDTGVDYTHPDLAAHMWVDEDGHYGRDFWNGDADPIDDHGHGTHCAGIIAAVRDNRIGISGVCQDARIMAVKAFSASGGGFLSVAMDATFYAMAQGADVLSNSWGAGGFAESNQLIYTYARSQGVIVVASAGNHGTAGRVYPAAYEHVIAVAATDAHDRRAAFSSFGEWIDLAAPGVDILSLRAAGTDMFRLFGAPEIHVFEDEYYISSGTSMACPHVAGAAALMAGQIRDWTADDIASRLRTTADDIAPLNPGFEDQLGSGRLNVEQALRTGAWPRLRLTGLRFEEHLGDGNDIPERGETLSLEAEITSEWVDAARVEARLVSMDPSAVVRNASAVLGDLAVGAAATLEFEIEVSPEAPRRLRFELQLDPANGAGEIKTLVIDLSRPLRDGWPRTFELDEEARLHALAADLDGDDVEEIIVSDGAMTVDVFDLNGDPLDGQWPRSVARGRQIAVGDLDGDGPSDIVVCGETAVHAFRADGTTMPGWPVPVGGTVVMTNLNGQGPDEVVVGSDSRLFVFSGNGTIGGPAWPEQFKGPLTRVAVADLNLDGTREMVFAAAPGGIGAARLHARRYDGSVPPGDWPLALGGRVPEDGVVIGDVTGGGFPEIVVVTREGTVHLLDADGIAVNGYWPIDMPDDFSPVGAALADLDGDGRLEVLLTGRSAQVYALDHRGHVLPGWPVRVAGPYSFLDPYLHYVSAVGELDGDGAADVLIGALTGPHLFAADGSDLDGDVPMALPVEDERTEQLGGLWLTDLSAAPGGDLLVAADDKLFVFEIEHSGVADVQWVGRRGDIRQSGAVDATAGPGDGSLAFDADVYTPDANARLTVHDATLDLDEGAIDVLHLEVSSRTERDPEAFTLHETGAASGVFVVAVPLASGAPDADGVVQVATEDVLVARYDHPAKQVWPQATAVVDGRGPAILHDSLNVVGGFANGLFYAEISWAVDEPANGLVHYGIGAPDQTSQSSGISTTPHVKLEGILPEIGYSFSLEVADAHGNTTVDDNGGAYYSVLVDSAPVTHLAVRLHGEPLSGGFTRIDVLGPDGTEIATFGYEPLSDDADRWLDVPVGEPVALEVTVVLPGVGLLGTFTTAPFDAPASVVVDLDSVEVTVVEDGVALAGAEVRAWIGCTRQSLAVETDAAGHAALIAPVDAPLSFTIEDEQHRVRTAAAYDSPGTYVVELTTAMPNVTALVLRDGRPVAGEFVRVTGASSNVGTVEVVTRTDEAGVARLWLCPGAEFAVHVGLFPDDVRSESFRAAPFDQAPEVMQFDISASGIVDSVPRHGAIDARQVYDPVGGALAGWDHVELVMASPQAWLTASQQFSLSEIGGSGAPPGVLGTERLDANRVRLDFDRPLEPGAWTVVRHGASGSGIRLGYLPGDVNGDGAASVLDILAMVDALNGAAEREPHATDVNRDTVTTADDLLALIDGLAGSDGPAWRGSALPGTAGLYWIDEDTGRARSARADGGGMHDVLQPRDQLSTLVCVTADAGSGRVYWATHIADLGSARIGRADRFGTHAEVMWSLDGVEPGACVADPASGWIVWTDVAGGKLQRGSLDGRVLDDLVVLNSGIEPGPIDVDWRTGDVYWVAMGAIWRTSLHLSTAQTPLGPQDLELVVAAEVNQPSGIAVDGHYDLVYWVEPATRRIMRARTSGIGITPIVDFGIDVPTGLAVDAEGGWIYWCDSGLNTIHRVDIGGFHLEFLILQDLHAPGALQFVP